MMKVKRADDNPLFLAVNVQPWPDVPYAAYVRVFLSRRDMNTGKPERKVTVRFDNEPADITTARLWAEAILRACDIAEQLERDGDIILEGEANNER